jgi:hypothetical protein
MTTLREAAEALVATYRKDPEAEGEMLVRVQALRSALAQPEERGAEWRAGPRRHVCACGIVSYIPAASPPEEPRREVCARCGHAAGCHLDGVGECMEKWGGTDECQCPIFTVMGGTGKLGGGR